MEKKDEKRCYNEKIVIYFYIPHEAIKSKENSSYFMQNFYKITYKFYSYININKQLFYKIYKRYFYTHIYIPHAAIKSEEYTNKKQGKWLNKNQGKWLIKSKENGS